MITKTHSFSGSQQITFNSDGFTLNGTLHLPDRPNPPIVIGCHGLLSNSDSPKQIALAKHCNTVGLAFFRFDHRGCGASQGDLRENTSFRGRCRDLWFALNKIQSLGIVNNRIGFFGSSLGGSVCLQVAGVQNIHALVTFSAPFRSRLVKIEPFHKNITFDLADRLEMIKNIHIFHGDADDTVPLSHAHFIYQRVSKPKKLTIQKNGDHRMSDSSHQDAFLVDAVQWFSKYLQ
jgi:alpha-beta hydrolase superfamily lysophospholipase